MSPDLIRAYILLLERGHTDKVIELLTDLLNNLEKEIVVVDVNAVQF